MYIIVMYYYDQLAVCENPITGVLPIDIYEGMLR